MARDAAHTRAVAAASAWPQVPRLAARAGRREQAITVGPVTLVQVRLGGNTAAGVAAGRRHARAGPRGRVLGAATAAMVHREWHGELLAC